MKSPYCDNRILETIVWLASLLMLYINHNAGLTRPAVVSLCQVSFKGLQSIDYSSDSNMVTDSLQSDACWLYARAFDGTDDDQLGQIASPILIASLSAALSSKDSNV